MSEVQLDEQSLAQLFEKLKEFARDPWPYLQLSTLYTPQVLRYMIAHWDELLVERSDENENVDLVRVRCAFVVSFIGYFRRKFPTIQNLATEIVNKALSDPAEPVRTYAVLLAPFIQHRLPLTCSLDSVSPAFSSAFETLKPQVLTTSKITAKEYVYLNPSIQPTKPVSTLQSGDVKLFFKSDHRIPTSESERRRRYGWEAPKRGSLPSASTPTSSTSAVSGPTIPTAKRTSLGSAGLPAKRNSVGGGLSVSTSGVEKERSGGRLSAGSLGAASAAEGLQAKRERLAALQSGRGAGLKKERKVQVMDASLVKDIEEEKQNEAKRKQDEKDAEMKRKKDELEKRKRDREEKKRKELEAKEERKRPRDIKATPGAQVEDDTGVRKRRRTSQGESVTTAASPEPQDSDARSNSGSPRRTTPVSPAPPGPMQLDTGFRASPPYRSPDAQPTPVAMDLASPDPLPPPPAQPLPPPPPSFSPVPPHRMHLVAQLPPDNVAEAVRMIGNETNELDDGTWAELVHFFSGNYTIHSEVKEILCNAVGVDGGRVERLFVVLDYQNGTWKKVRRRGKAGRIAGGAGPADAATAPTAPSGKPMVVQH
ncbi:hypothetical protein BJ742DRAFT_795163 [Cladochytrium replicatum]|nr:hypothetical protein BJ742DRAFT_795163 [Cladochytrium replicatum]